METLTSNTQAEATYNQVALDIIDIFDLKGFTTDQPVDVSELQVDIVNRIRQRVEGNINYGVASDPTQKELDDIIKDLESGCNCKCNE